MNKTHDSERELRLQDAADQAEREGAPASDAGIDAYRLVIRAVRQAAMPELPADFARRVSLRIAPGAEKASFEDGVVTLMLLGMALGGGGYFLPRFWPLLSNLVNVPAMKLPGVSWPLLIAAALGIAVAWAIDHFWDRHSHSGGMPA